MLLVRLVENNAFWPIAIAVALLAGFLAILIAIAWAIRKRTPDSISVRIWRLFNLDVKWGKSPRS